MLLWKQNKRSPDGGGIAVKKTVYSKEEEARQKELRKARFTEDERYRCLENLTETSQELSLIHSGMERCHPLHIWQGVRAEYIIHFVIRGKGLYTVGGRTYALEGGQMFLIRPDIKIIYIADEVDPWEYAWIGIRGERVPRLLAACGFHSGIDVLDAPDLQPILRNIQEILDLHELSDANTLFRESCLLRIIGGLIQYRRQLLPLDAAGRKPQQTKVYVTDAVSYIKSHYADTISVSGIAEILGISRAYLNKAFQQELGMSVQRFLIDYRMHSAANLLYNSEMSIQQISEAVGYEDQLTFSKAFKRKFGVSPTGYRHPSHPIRIYHEKQPGPPSDGA